MSCPYSYLNILTSGSTLESSPNSSGDKAAIRSSRSSRVTLTGATCKQTLTIKPYLCYKLQQYSRVDIKNPCFEMFTCISQLNAAKMDPVYKELFCLLMACLMFTLE